MEMFRVLRAARIVLNRHIRVAEDNANNMRLHKATGVGSLLLTDEKTNLPELFEPGAELVTYADENELVELARRERRRRGRELVCVHEVGVAGGAAGGACEANEECRQEERGPRPPAQVAHDPVPVRDSEMTELRRA